MHPAWVPQQPWSPYQQQPYAPQVAYVPMMVYGAQPFGPNPYNQWSNGNQYMPSMPSMPTPYPAAFNPSWGQPAPSMPHQQDPYTGNQARQRAPPRQPPPGFVSEENENASSSSNIEVGSQRPVLRKGESREDGGSIQPGTPQAHVGLPNTSTRASAKTTTNPPRSEIGSNDDGLKLSARIHDVQQITMPESFFEKKELSIKDIRSTSGAEGSLPPQLSNTIASEAPRGLQVAQCPKIPPEIVDATILLGLELPERPKTPINTVASAITQGLDMIKSPKTTTDTVTSIPSQAFKSTERPTTLPSRVALVVSRMHSSPLLKHPDPPLRFGRNVKVKQRVTPPPKNKRKRIISKQTDSEDESNEDTLHQRLPATKRDRREIEQLQDPSQNETLPVTKQVRHAKQLYEALQEESLQAWRRRSTRGSTKPINYYREITSEEADAMMLYSQDTSTLGYTQPQAHSNEYEFNSSESSFHPESPEPEVFANHPGWFPYIVQEGML